MDDGWLDDGWIDKQMYVCIFGELNKCVVGWINMYERMDGGKDIQMDIYIRMYG